MVSPQAGFGSSEPKGSRSVDVIIIGGGIVGQPMACLLADAGLDVVVVDRAPPTASLNASFDGRVFALSMASVKVLQAAGSWAPIAPHAQPILDIRAVDGDSPFFLHFDHREIGDRPFGYMVMSQDLRRGLWQAVDGRRRVDYRAPIAIARIDRGLGGTTVDLVDGSVLRAPLIIAADGKDSQTRQAAGILTHGWSYQQTGIVGAMVHDLPHDGIAIEHFRDLGPFATLPIRDDGAGRHRSGIVWCVDPQRAQELMALDQADFSRQLQAQVGDWLGTVALDGKKFAFPLGLSHAHSYYAPRLALIGDAAHAMHPIAGQGYNLGLRDVAQLAEQLVDSARLGGDLGELQLLKDYDRSRRFDTLSMMAMTDGLTRLFSTDFPPVKAVRGLGLSLVNKIAPARRLFMRGAISGGGSLVGSAPRLIRGELL